MPAHEPPSEPPGPEHDIDHDTDVLFDAADPDAGDGPAFDADAPAPPFHTPVPGEHLTPEELAGDFPGE